MVVAAIAGLGAAWQSWAETAARRYPPPGRLVEIDGHRMHLWCTGAGSPTVVLISGLGGWSLDWSRVQPEVAKSTRVCSYDRPGFGWSDTHASSLTPDGIVSDLHALLQAAGIRGPYVLVGQSVGGIYARLFATRYPSEVTGMVFVDSAHEEQYSRYPKYGAQAASQLRLLRFARYLAPLGLGRLIHQPVASEGLPAQDQAEANAIGYRTGAYFAFYDEASRFLASARTRLHLPARHFDVPIVVVTSGRHLQDPTDGKGWGELQHELVQLSPCGTQVVAPRAGHDVEIDNPHSVISAIQEIVVENRLSHGCPD